MAECRNYRGEREDTDETEESDNSSSDTESDDYKKKSKNIKELDGAYVSLSIKDPSYSIMTINVKYGEKGKGIKADERRKFYNKLIVNEHTDIILTQENNPKDIKEIKSNMKKEYSGDNYSDTSVQLSESFVTVLTKNSLLEQEKQEIRDKDLKIILKEEHKTLELKTLDENGVKGRLALTKVSNKDKKSGGVFIVGSWHGPHNKIKRDTRKKVFQELCQFMNNKFSNIPWIIGGDFNLGHNYAENQKPSDVKITKTDNEKIIYFVHTTSITVTIVKMLEKSEGKAKEEGKEYIDHYPLVARIDVKYTK